MTESAAVPKTQIDNPVGLRRPMGGSLRLFDAALLVRRLRLASGLVLFTYVLSHLANHALGIYSLALMQGGLTYFMEPWRSTAGTPLLLAASLTHLALAYWSLYRRRRLRMPAWEAAQLLLGLMIPPMVIEHVVTTRLAEIYFHVVPDYAYVIATFFTDPVRGWFQAALLMTAWVHGCIGLHFWLRLRRWYRAVLPILFGFAILVPVLALAGYWAAGREVQQLLRDPDRLRGAIEAWHLPSEADAARIIALRDAVWIAFASLLASTLGARLARTGLERRRGVVRLRYPEGRVVTLVPGPTVLEASRFAGIPHASVCGGRGRCSTCRVRVGPGAEHLPPPTVDEARVLNRVGADPSTRLACQIRPRFDLAVTPLLPPASTGPEAATPVHGFGSGREIEIAVLFADLRGFTTLAEHRLPYDTVFLLNRYFAEMGQAIEQANGYLDKFIGDGIMALFGLEDGPRWGAVSALTAAQTMAMRLADINRDLQHGLETPLRLGIGIHVGHAIVGDMGYGSAVALTAIGDVVNTASRLEALTKDYGAQLVISGAVAEFAELEEVGIERHRVMIRGRDQQTEIVAVPELSAIRFFRDRRTRPRGGWRDRPEGHDPGHEPGDVRQPS
jgi:adenylate cyclase